MSNTKTCTKCGLELSISEFYGGSNDSWCKYCRREGKRLDRIRTNEIMYAHKTKQQTQEHKKELPQFAKLQPKRVLVQQGDYFGWKELR